MTARESLEFPESHPLLRDGAAAGGLPRALAGTGQETRVLPSSGPRDQDAARCPPPGMSPGPVGEEGCVRLSSGRTRLPGRVPAPPRARESRGEQWTGCAAQT